ncbi:twin-arginine translocation signal domain-containing protein [Natrinema gelatinilyticum]|uniref:twin-arginine translocation signal domain-containing protein n=1 Tax=Natrinema gelatinilyticum TaxID=2961571 RepID=UPI0020C43681|nr:twin-arginine translocation signal domain-containing protein [Natrinema gelatinilyticum]
MSNRRQYSCGKQSDRHDTTPSLEGTDERPTRRRFLQAVAVAGTGLGATNLGSARGDTDRGNGFPPAGSTEWGPPVQLGNGTARTFTAVTPSGRPKCHGLYIDRAALVDLPSAAELEAASGSCYSDKYGPDGLALPIHHRWSQEFFVPFPETAATPYTFVGLNWNPSGHPPVWLAPHFDIHFHTLPMATVDTITGPAAPRYELSGEYVPAGFARSPAVDERVITDMGEHMVDPTVPEMNGGTFTNTLIWGAYDPDGSGTAELTFVEPMITRAFLRAHTGIDRRPIAQPETYARAGTYPTTYTVRDVPSADAIAITIEAFESFEGDD